MPAAQILYPAMQCADVFFLKANICQLGMDQRKVNMLAREYLDNKDVKKKYRFKPIILSHPMLMGLKQGQAKMSKSDPNSAIFMEDEPHQVKKKINSAYCPPGVVKDNPILDYTKHIIFNRNGKLLIKRKEENGGDVEYKSFEDLEKDYAEEKLHPGDLKPAVIAALNEMLEPVRKHFQTPKMKALLKTIRSYKVTR
uniref:tyrosine--tRNA ligase n=2 Tax=Lotharella globosa TaxID=91324 RepID=A0A7S4DMU6_9EUKA